MLRKYQTWIVVITAALMLGEHYLKAPVVADAAKEVRNWGIIISTFALGLGTINLCQIHAGKLQEKRSGWWNSIALLVTLALFASVGITRGISDKFYASMFDSINAPLQSALFGMTVYFLVSASYRSFVVRKAESAVILVTALIVMLAAVPVGRMISPTIPAAADWLSKVVNSAGQRGIIIGAAIGAIANGLRTMLGLERNWGG